MSKPIKSRCEFSDVCPLYHIDSDTCEKFSGTFCGTYRLLTKLTKKQREFYRLKSIFFGLHQLIRTFIRKHPLTLSKFDIIIREENKNEKRDQISIQFKIYTIQENNMKEDQDALERMKKTRAFWRNEMKKAKSQSYKEMAKIQYISLSKAIEQIERDLSKEEM